MSETEDSVLGLRVQRWGACLLARVYSNITAAAESGEPEEIQSYVQEKFA